MTVREPVTIVELHQDFCSLTYGEGACRATKTNQSKASRRSIFSNDVSPDNNANNGMFWRHTFDAEGQFTGLTQGDGFNIFAHNQGDPAIDWVLPNQMFSDPSSQGPFLFYRLTIDSPQSAEDQDPNRGNFHRRFYVNLSEGGTFSHVVQNPSIKDDLLDVLYIAIRNNENEDEAVAFFGEDRTEPYRFTFDSHHPMSRLLANVRTGDSMTYVIGRSDRRDFNSSSLNINRGSNTYTQSATGSSECYNTFHTCQDTRRENFIPVPLKLRFKFPTRAKPSDVHDAFPCLKDVSTSPTQINPSGVERAVSPFGKRARVKVTLDDFDYHDRLVDKYNRDPKGGTFWSRWKARNKHYVGRPLIIYEGEDGQQLEQMTSRFYVIDKIDGPDGKHKVTITAKDILKIAEDKSAVVPKPSKGRLENDITNTQGSLSLVPDGIGREYSQYRDDGYIRIGSEIMSFDINGDNMTIGRGALNTEAKAHEAGEIVQHVKRYPLSPGRAMRAHEIIYDLIVNEAGVNSEYIDRTEWWAEGNTWLSGHLYKTYLSKPTGITSLLGEIAQMGVSLWWDERNRKIRLNAISPERPEQIAAGYPHLSDDNALLEYPQFKEDHNTRLTRLFYYFNIFDYAKSRTEESNYLRLQIGVNLQAERDVEYGEQHSSTIFSRWLTHTEASIVSEILQRYLSRFEHAQIEVRAKVDIEALGDAWTGDIVTMQTIGFQNFDGSSLTKLWQIVSAEYKRDHAILTLHESDYPTQTILVSGLEEGNESTYTGDDPAGGNVRYAYVLANGTGTYANATEAQRDEQSAAWVADNDDEMSDDTIGYRII